MVNFRQVMGVVLSFLGTQTFSKNDKGRSILLAAQRQKLIEKYGEKFLNSFEKDLAEFEEKGGKAEESADAVSAEEQNANAVLLADIRKRLDSIEKKKAEMEKTIAEQEEKIAKMKEEKSADNGVAVEAAEAVAQARGFKPDANLMHNKWLDASFKGAAYSLGDSVDTTELKQEFGKYVSNEKMEIVRKLMGTTSSTAYMTSIVTDKVEYRAMSSNIDSVLQQFTSKWTPKGNSKFTPLTIKNRKCKINVAITPADVMEDVLGYLYDENLEPKDMPIVKYILQELIFPKLDEEREKVLAVGVFKEHTVAKDGDEASDAMDCMDGYLTQLVKLRKEDNEDVTWLLKDVTLTDANLLEQIDNAIDQVKPLYRNKQMFIHADPDLVIKYGRAYRKKYPYTKNEDGDKVKVDFTNFTFAPLEGMRGTGAFFITPKENFKHMRSRDPQSSKVYMQAENYDVKIFAEWWEATGFLLAEAIFAYIPQSLLLEQQSAETVEENGI